MANNISLANGVSGAAISAAQGAAGIPAMGSNLSVTDDMLDNLRKGWAAQGKGDKYLVAFFDLAAANGWEAGHFTSPDSDGSTATPETWARLKAMVQAALPKGVQTLLALPPEAARGQVAADWAGNDYTETGKPKDRRYWTQQVGSEIGKLGKKWLALEAARKAKADHLTLKEMIAQGDVEGAAAMQRKMEGETQKRRRDPVEMLDDALSDSIKRIEKAMESGADLVALKAWVVKARSEVRAFAKAKAD